MNRDEEKSFLLSLLSGRTIESVPELDWPRFTEMACREGVGGILYQALKECKIPQSASEKIEKQYYTALAVNVVNLEFLEQLEKKLQTEKIDVLTLKGASLLSKVYPDPGMRPMEDLDILVHEGDRDRFIKLLDRMGYVPTAEGSHRFIRGISMVDIHGHALNIERIPSRTGLFPSGMAPIWERSVPWKSNYNWIRRPEDMDNFFLLAQHQLKHSFSRLIWLMDILFLLKDNKPEFWTRLCKRATELNQARPMAYIFYLLKVFFDFKAPQGFASNASWKRISRIERMILDWRAGSKNFEHSDFLLSLFCLENFNEKCRFIWENFFPDKAVLEEEFGMMVGGKTNLLYPYRILQMAWLVPKQTALMIKDLFKGSK